MKAAHVLVTVWCGQCSEVGREKAGKNPAKLGTLRLDAGRRVWHPERSRRKLRSEDHRLSDDGRREVHRSAPPTVPQSAISAALEARVHARPQPHGEWLPVYCPVHGEGGVLASAVLAASGNVDLKIRATA